MFKGGYYFWNNATPDTLCAKKNTRNYMQTRMACCTIVSTNETLCVLNYTCIIWLMAANMLIEQYLLMYTAWNLHMQRFVNKAVCTRAQVATLPVCKRVCVDHWLTEGSVLWKQYVHVWLCECVHICNIRLTSESCRFPKWQQLWFMPLWEIGNPKIPPVWIE